MGEIINLLIIVLWIPQAAYQILLWLYWLQTKEYRFDRFGVFLQSKDGLSHLQVRLLVLKTLIYALALILNNVLPIIALLVALDLFSLLVLKRHMLRRPIFTQRAIRILITTLLLAGIVIGWSLISNQSLLLTLVILEAVILLGSFLGILWTLPLVLIIKKRETEAAAKKLKNINPVVVGITGSYGKSTTKEFTAYLLSQKFKVEKTVANENTEFGVARKILRSLPEDTEYFVAEMGAYKKGEIAKITHFAQPNIAVVTGIEPQHLALFGSLENIMQAKFELVEGLKKGGVALFNLNNSKCKEMYQWAKQRGIKTLGYYVGSKQEDFPASADITACLKSVSPEGISFEVQFERAKHLFKTKLPGVHFIQNLTAAILVARLSNVSWSQIEQGVKTLVLPNKTMAIRKTNSGVIVIDDSYNTTPASFNSALEYLNLYPSNYYKVVVTPGIIELGKMGSKIHQDLGRSLSQVADKVFLTTEEFESDLRKNIVEGKLQRITNANPVLDLTKSHKNLAILIEGRISQSIKSELDKL